MWSPRPVLLGSFRCELGEGVLGGVQVGFLVLGLQVVSGEFLVGFRGISGGFPGEF